MSEYNQDILTRRWALNCAVAFFSKAEASSTEAVLETAQQFEKYLRGDKNG